MPDTKGEYPDGALAAFSLVLCFGEHQPQRGRFRNRQVLSALLGRRARWISFLIEHGDLVQQDKNVLYIDGWDEWQEGDWKVAERMKRVRERQKRQRTDTPTDTPVVTVPVTPTDTVPTVTGLSEPLAVSGRPLATSKHGDTAGVGDRPNGSPALLSPQVQVVRLLDWFMAKHGWSTWASLEVQKREAQQAIAIIELGIPFTDLIASLDAMWHATDPDDRPSSLKYFWTRLQLEQHASVKQQGSHASSGLTKVDVATLKPAREAKP